MRLGIEGEWRELRTDRLVRWVCCGLFFGTAGLKLLAFQRGGGYTTAFPNTLLLLIASGELIVGLLLAALPAHFLTQVGSIGLSAAFVGASTTAWWLDRSCGCFGDLHLLPLDRLLVSTALIVGVLVSLRAWIGASQSRWWLWVAPVCALAGGIVEHVMPHEPASAGAPPSSVLRLLPRDVFQGDWQVVVVRPTCPSCREYVEGLLQARPPADSGQLPHRAVLILGQPMPWLSTLRPQFEQFVVTEDRSDLQVRTPSEIKLHDGRVVTAHEGTNHD